MKQKVVLSIRGQQSYVGQDPDVIELVTEGTLERLDDRWEICYEETALTGMEGVKTCFCVEPDRIVLTRSGKLNSQMVFREGVPHETLYQMEFGALMLSVTATKIAVSLSNEGGTVDLNYNIEIEHSSAGLIVYHLDLKPQE